MTLDLDRFHQVLGYRFTDNTLIRQALTHRSASANHNERFEFLGDAILGLVIADELFDLFPNAKEGDLSRMRASLVNRQILAEIAAELTLGDFLQLGLGERKSGGSQRSSILSDAVEAIFAAVYLDSDLASCKKLIRRIFRDRIANLSTDDQQKDSKTRLQEYLQARALDLPDYRVVDIAGDAHDQTFTVECDIAMISQSTTGKGKSKRLAEQDAATRVLKHLENEA